MPSGTIAMDPPPELPAADGGSMMMMMLPMLGSVGAIAMVTMVNRGPAGFLTGGMVLMSSLGFVAVNGWRQRAQRNAEVLRGRRDYLTFLAETRKNVRIAAAQQFRALAWRLPHPSTLVYIAEERSRVWERTKDSPDFLKLRVGVSDQRLAVELELPVIPTLAQLDPVCASALHRFVVTHERQPDLPFAVDGRSSTVVQITSQNVEVARTLLRSMVIGAATLHHPEDLVIAFVVREDRWKHWDWVKWLPHAHSRRQKDRLGPVRMVTTSFSELTELLPEDLTTRERFAGKSSRTPHVLVVCDGVERPFGDSLFSGDGVDGLTVLERSSTWKDIGPHQVRIDIPENGTDPASVMTSGTEKTMVVHDSISIPEAEETARRLLPLYKGPAALAAGGATKRQMGITELLGLPDVRDLDLDMAWRERLNRDRLRVPIGQDDKGKPLVLDLKEAAQDGMGPHGVMIGATGSGKSEVLRTLVLALALTHSPEQLNFVLVDYKGGATFAGMADMPHVSAIITNLGRESSLVDRFEDALKGEVTRRQEVLREAGNFANVTDYEEARRNGRTDLAPLPALLVVLDEFSELLDARAEFINSFVNIGRVGRSLSVHLLFASQRLEAGKLKGLDTYLSYRIGLRTFSGAESRAILDSDVAFTLPREPGGGYLLVTGSKAMTRFRAAYVSGKLAPRQVQAVKSASSLARDEPIVVEPFTIARVGVHEEPEPVEVDPADAVMEAAPEGNEFEIAVAAMAGRGPDAHKIWLPPLETPEPLDRLFEDLAVDPRLGLISPRWRAAGALTVPVGLTDVPFEQRREPLALSLAGAGGHVVVVGRPLSGKTTLLRTMVCALALTSTPLEVQFYVLDFGGGAFVGLRDLPHVSGVASRTEPDVVRRTLAEVKSVIDAREVFFRTHGIDSMDTYRQRRARGEIDDGWGDIFLVIDGWGVMRTDFEDEEIAAQNIVARGLTFGVHLMASVSRWMEMRPAVQDLVGTRLELRLGDPSDSAFKKNKVAEQVPLTIPGRGLHPVSGLHTMAALPRIDGSADVDTLTDGVADLVAGVRAAWTGPAGPKLRLLPERIGLDEVRAQARPDDPRILLGVDEDSLAPFGVDPATEPHLFLFGEGGSGKSTMLRVYAEEVVRLYTGAKKAKFFVVDYRRALLDQIPEEHLMSYSTSHETATAKMQEVASFFRSRLPGENVTAEQLRNRSWWTGAEGFVLIDDYDLVATSQGNPLLPLVPLLPQAADIGLHVIITRHSGGASRAMYDAVLQRFNDLGATGILLSGNPAEGALIAKVKPVQSIPGRAQIVSRERGRFAGHLAYVPSKHE